MHRPQNECEVHNPHPYEVGLHLEHASLPPSCPPGTLLGSPSSAASCYHVSFGRVSRIQAEGFVNEVPLGGRKCSPHNQALRSSCQAVILRQKGPQACKRDLGTLVLQCASPVNGAGKPLMPWGPRRQERQVSCWGVINLLTVLLMCALIS